MEMQIESWKFKNEAKVDSKDFTKMMIGLVGFVVGFLVMVGGIWFAFQYGLDDNKAMAIGCSALFLVGFLVFFIGGKVIANSNYGRMKSREMFDDSSTDDSEDPSICRDPSEESSDDCTIGEHL